MPRRREPHPFGLAVGRRIAALRTEQDMTMEQLALRSDVSKDHLTNIEHGRALATFATLEKIARGLGVEVFYLLVFPGRSVRDQCVEKTREFSEGELKKLLRR